nr:hypothetical protein [Tanacetum cinerariifolium]
LYREVVSTFLFLEFEEVLRLLLVGSMSSSEADSDGGVIGLAIFLPLYLNVKELVVRNFIQFVLLLDISQTLTILAENVKELVSNCFGSFHSSAYRIVCNKIPLFLHHERRHIHGCLNCCVFRNSWRIISCSYNLNYDSSRKYRVREFDLLLIHGWVTRRYLSARMGGDQQLPPGHSRRMPRCCRSHSATGYFFELHHMPNVEFLIQYNKVLAQHVAMGSQLRLHFEQEVSNDQLTQQVLTLQTQVTGKERIKAAFEEFKKYEDDRVEKRISEGLEHGIEHGKAGRDLEVVEAYESEANSKYLQDLLPVVFLFALALMDFY